jgi:polyhydroxybutyrate depolymerase
MFTFMRSLLMMAALVATLLPALSVSATTIDPPAGDWGPGNYPANALSGSNYLGISGVTGQGSLIREYIVHIPNNYVSNVPMPLVFCFHGLVESIAMFCIDGSRTSSASVDATGASPGNFIDLSEKNGFIVLMVQGYSNSWNGGDCCGAAKSKKLDDVALIRAILAVVEQHLNVDRSRVYAAGFSNGAFMANRLACEASDIFAAIVSGSGGIQLNPMSDCKPANKVAVLEVHGNKDALVPYKDGAASVAYWAQINGCSTQTSAASFPPSGGDTQCVSYQGCATGGQVTFCTITKGGHCWYGSPSCGTGFGLLGASISLAGGKNSDTMVDSDAVWPFLSQYHR